MVQSEPIIPLQMFLMKSHVILAITSYKATTTIGWPPLQGGKQP